MDTVAQSVKANTTAISHSYFASTAKVLHFIHGSNSLNFALFTAEDIPQLALIEKHFKQGMEYRMCLS